MDEEANPWDHDSTPTDATKTSGTPETTSGGPAAASGSADSGYVAPGPDSPAELTDPSRNKIVLGAVAAFVVIALVGFLLARGGDDDEPAADGGPTTQAAAGGPTVAISGTRDPFDRDDSTTSLGELPNGAPWTVTAGTWGIQNGEAYLANPSPDRRDFAVVGLGRPEGQAQVRMTTLAEDAGLAFRYRGPFNYWALVAVPEFATWNIVKVVDGKQDPVGNTGRSAIGDGTLIGVRLTGDRIQIVINGEVVKTITDEALAGSGKVGLTARGEDAAKARFDDFVAGGPKGQGVVVPKPDGEGEDEGEDTTTTAPPTTTA